MNRDTDASDKRVVFWIEVNLKYAANFEGVTVWYQSSVCLVSLRCQRLDLVFYIPLHCDSLDINCELRALVFCICFRLDYSSMMAEYEGSSRVRETLWSLSLFFLRSNTIDS